MPTYPHGTVAHFAVNADDDTATKAFYEALFGWTFQPWGPPSFFHIRRGDGDLPGPIGALQARRELEAGLRMTGFECTVAVDDIDAAVEAARAHGGEVLMDKTTIVGVGDLAFLKDPSGNVVGAMRYDDRAE
jgi:predicted enzyme related to lactoylglutathione lyase